MLARLNTIGIDHPCFSHLDGKDRFEYNAALATGRAMTVEFVDEKSGEFICAAIYSVHGSYLHVTELAGRFVKKISVIEKFTQSLARALHLTKISYTPRRWGTKKIGEALGFSMNDFGEFEKAV